MTEKLTVTAEERWVATGIHSQDVVIDEGLLGGTGGEIDRLAPRW